MKSRLTITLIILFCLLPLIHSCNTVQKKTYVKNGTEYGVTKGLNRGRWWSLYERGISFGEGEYLNEAEEDFRAALKQRQEDQRTARTYGMHFVDYFPHRELGVILYKQKRFQEAIAELETSLSNEESAKAKFYLNKAREARIKGHVQDTRPPRIVVTAPEREQTVNSFSVMLEAMASDENYVSSIAINNVPEFIELSGKSIQFKKEIPLVPGSNRITVTARDLLGNFHKETFTITADYQGPNLSVLNYVNKQQINQEKIELNLSVSDESGIEYVSVEGDKQYFENSQGGVLSVPLTLKNGENRIRMEALDKAGNKTSGEISVIYYPGKLVASNESYGMPGENSITASDAFYISAKPETKDTQAPEINLKGLLKVVSDNEPLTITGRKSNNRFFIEGQISDTSNVDEILVNDDPIAFFQGKLVAFSKLVEFKEGENVFKIYASDSKGNASEKSVKVIRQIQQIDLEESKMTLSIMPFKNNIISPGMADSVYNLFMQEIINSERFKVIERGPDFEAVLRELKLSQTDLVDKQKAVQAGKLLTSEATLIGNIIEKENEIEIYAKLINVETSEYIAVHDVYSQDKSRSRIEYLMAGLASEIVYSVPLIEGQVLAVKGNQFFLDIGKEKYFNIKKGIKCLVYRSTPFIVDGVRLGDETSILGTLLINSVKPKFSSAVLSETTKNKLEIGEIKKSDKVITK